MPISMPLLIALVAISLVLIATMVALGMVSFEVFRLLKEDDRAIRKANDSIAELENFKRVTEVRLKTAEGRATNAEAELANIRYPLPRTPPLSGSPLRF